MQPLAIVSSFTRYTSEDGEDDDGDGDHPDGDNRDEHERDCGGVVHNGSMPMNMVVVTTTVTVKGTGW